MLRKRAFRRFFHLISVVADSLLVSGDGLFRLVQRANGVGNDESHIRSFDVGRDNALFLAKTRQTRFRIRESIPVFVRFFREELVGSCRAVNRNMFLYVRVAKRVEDAICSLGSADV